MPSNSKDRIPAIAIGNDCWIQRLEHLDMLAAMLSNVYPLSKELDA